MKLYLDAAAVLVILAIAWVAASVLVRSMAAVIDHRANKSSKSRTSNSPETSIGKTIDRIAPEFPNAREGKDL